MKELQNFRRFLNEEIMKGDSVVLKGDDEKMEVLSVRDMFASDLKAYRVKNADGETFEYSEDQIEKVNLEEMDEESWNDKNSPARGDQLRDPKKVGQATGPYSIRKEEINEGDLFSSEFDRQELKAIINDLNKGLILDMPTRRAYKFLVSLLDNEDKEELGLNENMYIDDEEFEMEMGRSKKDSLKKEMIMKIKKN